jgi:hypothetical protein
VPPSLPEAALLYCEDNKLIAPKEVLAKVVETYRNLETIKSD